MSREKRKPKPTGLRLLAAVAVAYLVLAFVDRKVFDVAAEKSLEVIGMLIPIFAIVILLMALIGYFFQERTFMASLPGQRGFRGWMIALVVGLLSHGPMYAWYPMLQSLREKGLRDGYIATFFYARAVKLPLLPLMVDYFGLTFTVVLTLYIIIASLLQGWLVEVLE